MFLKSYIDEQLASNFRGLMDPQRVKNSHHYSFRSLSSYDVLSIFIILVNLQSRS